MVVKAIRSNEVIKAMRTDGVNFQEIISSAVRSNRIKLYLGISCINC